MATIDIEVAGRKYALACRDGEEDHLRSVAAMVDKRARDAGKAAGTLSETRQLLFAALLLADDLKELKSGTADANAADPQLGAAAEALAARVEALAERLEAAAAASSALEDQAANA